MTGNKLADFNLTLIFSIKLDGPNLLISSAGRMTPFHMMAPRYLQTRHKFFFNGEIVSCDCAAPFTFDAIKKGKIIILKIRNFSPRNLNFFFLRE
jgi:hypothetical protein